MKRYAKKVARWALLALGYEIYRASNQRAGYDFEREAREKILLVRGSTMLAYECLVTLWQQVRHCEINKVPGCYVECGVWKGGAVGLMALANLSCGSERRHIHLFDVFEDICEPDPKVDGERAVSEAEQWAGVKRDKLSGRLTPIVGFYDKRGGPGTVEEVKRLLEDKVGYGGTFLHYHKGWFQNTLPVTADEIGDIALLHLDCDWYASTKICLEYLYDKVVPTGFIIIDDYGAYEGCKKAVDEFIETREIKAFLSHVNMDCRYWIKP